MTLCHTLTYMVGLIYTYTDRFHCLTEPEEMNQQDAKKNAKNCNVAFMGPQNRCRLLNYLKASNQSASRKGHSIYLSWMECTLNNRLCVGQQRLKKGKSKRKKEMNGKKSKEITKNRDRLNETKKEGRKIKRQ